MTLLDMTPGQVVQVASLDAQGMGRRRLLDLGFVPGTRITIVRKSPLGDPVAYRVRGATIALRNCDARQVLVER